MTHYRGPDGVGDPDNLSVFIAGPVAGDWDWQAQAATAITSYANVDVYNPRRIDNPDWDDYSVGLAQSVWEHRQLREASIIMFWFAPISLAPLSMFELGFWLNTGKPIVVGVHPDFERGDSIRIQSSLTRPTMGIYEDFTNTVEATISALSFLKVVTR
jgi:hypothetical protein